MRQPEQRDIWSVSALNRASRELLESGLGVIWVEAEISNLARPASGHIYFSLKDAGAQLRGAFFRQRQRGSATTLANGDKVLVRGKLSIYEPRGDYQLIVDHVEPAGEGALRRAFEVLKLKLAAEGLFSESRKQPLPAVPRRIGVITSPSGAAIRDVLHVLERRMPSVPVIIYAASVQGERAASELTKALRLAVARDECDVLILTRGGGALEDLAAFNDETLARAIAECPIPLICGVGHETDVTIADFVADVRAPTPSAAAELVVPDQRALLSQLDSLNRRLLRGMARHHDNLAQRLDQAARRLQLRNPINHVATQNKRLLDLRPRLQRSLRRITNQQSIRLQQLATRLQLRTPRETLGQRQRNVEDFARRLKIAQRRVVDAKRTQLERLGQTLNAVSPLATMARGYAIVRTDDGTPVTDVSGIEVGSQLVVSLRDGNLRADVVSVAPDTAAENTSGD